jgi:putative phosphoribosyl transferase
MWGQSQIEVGLPHQQAELFSDHAARALVVFAHGDGGNRTSWRSREMAHALQRRGLSSLLVDLLTPAESDDKESLYDIDLLAGRLMQVLDALPADLCQLPLGLLGSDTGTAAAIVVAVRRSPGVRALVSRGGRPELAGDVLGALRAATLLIVGAADADVLAHNRRAYLQLRCHKRIDIVPRATHQFLEAGAFDAATRLAGDWFAAHLVPQG